MNRRGFLARALAGAVASCVHWLPMPRLPQAGDASAAELVTPDRCEECGDAGAINSLWLQERDEAPRLRVRLCPTCWDRLGSFMRDWSTAVIAGRGPGRIDFAQACPNAFRDLEQRLQTADGTEEPPPGTPHYDAPFLPPKIDQWRPPLLDSDLARVEFVDLSPIAKRVATP